MRSVCLILSFGLCVHSAIPLKGSLSDQRWQASTTYLEICSNFSDALYIGKITKLCYSFRCITYMIFLSSFLFWGFVLNFVFGFVLAFSVCLLFYFGVFCLVGFGFGGVFLFV